MIGNLMAWARGGSRYRSFVWLQGTPKHGGPDAGRLVLREWNPVKPRWERDRVIHAISFPAAAARVEL